MADQLSEFLDVAIGAVKEAEKVILKNFGNQDNVSYKSDGSPVTIADQQAEEIIKKYISEHYSGHAFLGEETGKTNSSEYIWVIDPIDGTKNYTRGIPLFGTQLALMIHGEVVVGVSNAPAINELLYASRGNGAFLNDDQHPIEVSKVNELDKAYLSYGGINRFKRQSQLDTLLRIDQATLGHRGYGEFWSYHLIAQGKIDIAIEAETKIWDVAALSVIVEEAGGKVTDIKGQPIGPDTRSAIATNGKLHSQVLTYFVNKKL